MTRDSDIKSALDIYGIGRPRVGLTASRDHSLRERVGAIMGKFYMLAATALLAMAVMTIAASPRPASSQEVELVVDVATVAKGYRASQLTGRDVVNDQRERIGRIDDFIFGRDDRALFAVLQVGGLPGLGGHLVAVPFHSLVLNDPSGKIVLPQATRDALNKLPVFKYGG